MPANPGRNVMVCGVLLGRPVIASRSDVPWPKLGSVEPLSSSNRVVRTKDCCNSNCADVHLVAADPRDATAAWSKGTGSVVLPSPSKSSVSAGTRALSPASMAGLSPSMQSSCCSAVIPQRQKSRIADTDLVARLAVDEPACAAGADEVGDGVAGQRAVDVAGGRGVSRRRIRRHHRIGGND